MKRTLATICLTLAVLLGSAGVSWGKDCKIWWHLAVSGKCSSAFQNQDYKTAVKEWEPFAVKGNDKAQFNLDMTYAYYLKNYIEAVKWYELSVQNNNSHAQRHLAELYESGKGVIKDIVYAHMWANLAARHGHGGIANMRDRLEKTMNPAQLEKALDLARQCIRKKYKGC